MYATATTAASSDSLAGDKKLTRSKSGLRIVPVHNTQRSPFELREPVWSPDSESSCCCNVSCGVTFDLLHRRHHCRRCGRLFCGQCCQTRVPLTRMCFVDPVRQCLACADLSSCEQAFFARSLKLLLQGAEFTVETGDATASRQLPRHVVDLDVRPGVAADDSDVVLVCLSADHRLLTFRSASGAAVPDSVLLHRIDQLSVDAPPTQQHVFDGGAVPGTVNVLYRPANRVEQLCVRLLTRPAVCDCRRSAHFIHALQKAMELVNQSREPSAN